MSLIPRGAGCFLFTAATSPLFVIFNQKFAVPGCAGDSENTPVSGVFTAIPGHRFYSPFQGRFINKDPIEEAGGLNLYSFCGNNGVNRWDMLGMSTGVTQVEVYDEHLGIYITYDHYSGGFDGEGIGDDFLTASGWGENSRPSSDYSADNQSFIDEADARTVAGLEAAGDYTLSRPDQGMTFGEIAANLGLTSDNKKGVVTLGPLEEVPMDKPTPVAPYQPIWDGTSGLSPFPSTAPSRNTSLDRINAIMDDFSTTHGSALLSAETLGNFIGQNYNILNPAGWVGSRAIGTLGSLGAKSFKLSGKERASNVPSWAQGQKPTPGQNGKDFAKELLDGKYGPGNYGTGPGSEYNQLKKFGDRGR